MAKTTPLLNGHEWLDLCASAGSSPPAERARARPSASTAGIPKERWQDASANRMQVQMGQVLLTVPAPSLKAGPLMLLSTRHVVGQARIRAPECRSPCLDHHTADDPRASCLSASRYCRCASKRAGPLATERPSGKPSQQAPAPEACRTSVAVATVCGVNQLQAGRLSASLTGPMSWCRAGQRVCTVNTV